MAQVFQCDACKKTGTKMMVLAVDGKNHELCNSCTDRVKAVLSPKPKGPKPAGA